MPVEQQSLPLRPQSGPYGIETTSSGSEDDMAPNQQRGLFDAISDKLAYSEFSLKEFLPQDDFEALITETTVKEELDRVALGKFELSLVKYIAEHARKTFAILVYGAAAHRALCLEKFKFGDKYLPIALEGSCLTSLSGFARDSYAWRWFHKWSTQEKSFFCKEQWIFLPQSFTDDSTMEVLHRDCRLPFITCEFKSEGGSFSFVHKATIHHAHHTIGPVSIALFNLYDFANLNRRTSSSRSKNYARRKLGLTEENSLPWNWRGSWNTNTSSNSSAASDKVPQVTYSFSGQMGVIYDRIGTTPATGLETAIS